MKTLLKLLIYFAFLGNLNSQTVALPETLISVNTNYFKSTNIENACNNVKQLEQALLNFKHSNIEKLYETKNDIYRVSFETSEGKIIAWFNKQGKIIRTYEKYNNVRLPEPIIQAVINNYPNYNIIEDIYVLRYHSEAAKVKEEYKIKIKNQEEIITVKMNAEGNFI